MLPLLLVKSLNRHSACVSIWPASPRAAAAPVYGPGGELEYIGDLSTGGALSYIHDVVYIALFVQLAGCFTDYAWLACLLVRRGPGLREGRGAGRRMNCPV